MASVGSVSRAWSFDQSIGVNTHMSWLDAGYTNVAVVEASLAYLGVTHVRDSIPLVWDLSEYEAIAATGVKFDILSTSPVSIASDLAAINQLEQAVPGSIASVEGVNEFNLNTVIFDNVSSLNDPAWIQLYGPALYAAVRADPLLAGVPVIAASTGNAGAAQVAQEGKLSSFVNSSNWHEYFGNGSQPAAGIAYAVAEAESTAPGLPVTITETGYYTAVDAMDWGGGGVTPAVQAILTVNDLLDAFHDGVQTTYLYELMDNISNPSSTDLEDSFGLFYANGTPKPAAIAIHNLTTILSDTGANAATFQTGTLNATINGLPSTGNTMVLEKSNGAFDIVIWNEPTVWNETTMTEVFPASVSVTVNFGSTYGYVELFDPLQSSAPIETFTNVSSIQLSLSADPYIIELEPYPAPQTYSPGSAGGTIESQGPDTVLVGTGVVTVYATGPTIDIVGGAGALTYSGTAQATITGGSGAMNLTLSRSGSRITGGTGGMTVLDLVGGNIIEGYQGSANTGINVTTTAGNDEIITGGWPASNVIHLGAGNDTVIINGATNLTGSTGNDTITVNAGWCTIITGTGSSTVTMKVSGVVTTYGRDTVIASTNLTLTADGPSTTVTGGSGYIWFSGHGSATITGGIGGGYFNLTQITGGSVTTAAGATDTILLGAAGGTIVSLGTDWVQLGAGAATITANGPSIGIAAGAGSLTYSGPAIATITGGSGAMNLALTANGSTVTTSTGTAKITVGGWQTADTLKLGSGNDTVIATGPVNITGTTGTDTITINGGWDTITTGTGSSVVTMNASGVVTTNGHDTVIANTGLTLTANGPSTTVQGGSGYIWFSGDGGATVTGGIGGGYFNLSQMTSAAITTAAGASDSILLGAAGGTINSHGSDYITLGSGAATVTAFAGTSTVLGGTAKMTFVEGAANATVNVGTGPELFTLTNGHAGGTLTINDFVPGSDTINLVGYQSGQVATSVANGSTLITLSDNSHIVLTNFSSAAWHPTIS
jgi:hypothetical protein